MKIRDGHVSNSSSSSFVLVTTKANYERALSEIQEGAATRDNAEFILAVAKKLAREGKLAGIDIVSFSTYSCEGEGTIGQMCVDVESKEEDYGKYEAWDEFRTILRSNKDDVFVSSQCT
jgi:hypothetical protein